MPALSTQDLIAAAVTAVEQHLRIGPGLGIASGVDLRWRLGEALDAVAGARMPYYSAAVVAVAKALIPIYGLGFSTTVLFDSRRLFAVCPYRAKLPREMTWMQVRAMLQDRGKEFTPGRASGKTAKPCSQELRRLCRRTVALLAPTWVEVATDDPHRMLFWDLRGYVEIRLGETVASPRGTPGKPASAVVVQWYRGRVRAELIGRQKSFSAEEFSKAFHEP